MDVDDLSLPERPAQLVTMMEIDTLFGPDVPDKATSSAEQIHVPTRDQCIEAIVRDANCSYAVADRIDQLWYALATTWLRGDPYYLCAAGFGGTYIAESGIYVLDDRDLTSLHPALEIIAPDGCVAGYCSGTAHDLLNRRHCSDLDTGARAGLVHTKTAETAPQCAVCIALTN